MSDQTPTPIRRARPAQETTVNADHAPGGGAESNKRVLKAIIIGPAVKENVTTGRSKDLPPDSELDTLAQTGKLVEPPFDPLVLAMLLEHSTELQPCIEAMEINIDGTGFRLDPRVKVDDPKLPPQMKEAVEAERVVLANFFSNCCVEDSFTSLRRKTRRDREATGNGYWEVIRNPRTDAIEGFNHIPAHQMRLGRLDESHTEFTRKKHVLKAGGAVALENERVYKRFRRFAQLWTGSSIRSISGASAAAKVRWFKEFMDPRVIDNTTGEVVPAEKQAGFPEERRASEIIHFKLYSPRSPYGLPRFIGNLITIFGDRAADEVNFVTLKNNNIPSMVVAVANGQLTEGSIQRIEQFVESQIQGSSNYSRFLVIEAEGALEGDSPQAKLDIKPLVSEQMRDQMFQQYGKNNGDKVRRSFRLPPIFVGRAEDYNRATADASRELADDQVFKPERDDFDSFVNKMLLPEMGIIYHKFISNGTNTTDPETLVKVLMAAERTGGLTPRLARQIVSEIMGRDLPEIDPAKMDPDVPFSIQIAQAVKNQAAMETGSPEVGSQVTALKSLATPAQILASLVLQRDAMEDELVRSLMGGSAANA